MASNPMQRKARNSFILGVLIAVLICGCIIAYLFMQIKEKDEQINSYKQNKKTIYVLKEDVAEGSVITSDDLTKKDVYTDIPADAIVDGTAFDISNITLKEGGSLTQSVQGNKTVIKYKDANDREYDVTYVSEGVYTYENDGKTYTLNCSVQPFYAKIELKKNTILTQGMRMSAPEITDDLRTVQIQGVQIPIEAVTDDYVDVRILYPTGEDFVVISKKQISFPVVDSQQSLDIFTADLKEEEILYYSAALIDTYLVDGTKMYITRYTDPGVQTAAYVTYVPNNEVLTLLEKDGNISDISSLLEYFNSDGRNELRNKVEDLITSIYQGDESSKASTVKSNMSTDISNASDQRTKYLKALAQAATSKSSSTSSTSNTTNTTNKTNTTSSK